MTMLSQLSIHDLFACCLYGEARGEPEEGKRAVAGVIQNRSQRRGQTLRQVILAPKQFSWTDPKDPNYSVTINAYKKQAALWLKCKIIALEAFYDPSSHDYSCGADHYLNDKLVLKLYGKLPRWARQGIDQGRVTVRIKNHVFLNLEG